MQRSYEEQTEAECLRENNMTTKSDVISRLHDLKRTFNRAASSDREHSASYYRILDNMLDKMINKVERTHLFESLEDWWFYSFEISSDGICLKLEQSAKLYFDDDGEIEPCFIEESFDLIMVSSRMLTVDEYAKLYNVDNGTVRQWIRRGKLRTAVKHGSEWRIPELSEPEHGRYRMGQYKITGHIDNLPDEYSFINNCSLVWFEKCRTDTDTYRISFDKGYKTIMCNSKERERIERVLIASPDAKFISDFFGAYD